MAEKDYPPLLMPDNVGRTTVAVWSDGLALDADIHRPTDVAEGATLPAVVLGHGWGGIDHYGIYFDGYESGSKTRVMVAASPVDGRAADDALMALVDILHGERR